MAGFIFNRDSSSDVNLTDPMLVYTDSTTLLVGSNLYDNTGSNLEYKITSIAQDQSFDLARTYKAWSTGGYPTYGYIYAYTEKEIPAAGDIVWVKNGGTEQVLEYYVTDIVDTHAGKQIKISESEAHYANTQYIRYKEGDVTSQSEFVPGYYSCLTGDTEILMADKSIKLLRDIEVNDEVLSIDPETKEFVKDKVIFTDKIDPEEFKTQEQYTLHIFANEYKVKTVLRHRFYNVENACFKYMDEWNIGEHTLTADGQKISLLGSEIVKEKVRHYKITTEKYHNYFANGILTGSRLTKPFKLENE